eukprot:294094_1
MTAQFTYLLISLLSFDMRIYGIDHQECVTTGRSTDNVILNTNDKIVSPNGNVQFVIDSNGDACIKTFESNVATQRWCLLYIGIPVETGGKFVVEWNGDLTYMSASNAILWSSHTATLTDVSPLSLCVTDCGRVKLIRNDNHEEIWNPDYERKSPTTYPSCSPPTNAPTNAPTNSAGCGLYSMGTIIVIVLINIVMR